MRVVLYAIALVLATVLAGCSVNQNYVAVHVNYEPRLAFKPDTTTIVLTNRVNFDKEGNTAKRKIEALKDGAFTSLKYAATQLNKVKHVHTILTADSSIMAPDTDSVAVIARKYRADYVLTLEKFKATIDLDDYNSGTAFYGTHLSLAYKLNEGNSPFYKNLPAEVSEAQSEVPDGGLLLSLVFAPSIKRNHSSVNVAAQHATQQALQDYLPSEILNNRQLYNSPELNAAVTAIKANQLLKADILLKPLIDHVNPDLASKASYNMAVVYEMDGNIESARELAELSIKKKDNQLAKALLNDLKQE